ncbi:MAG TPA: hypothetical protein VFC36_03155 [Paludibacter sp.]|nr:hypothetical protein [Paludibacter sp.]
MANCILKEGGIDITGLSLMEAHQIKIALIHFSKKNLPATREERNFNVEIVTSLDKAQDSMCRALPEVCL